MNDPIRLEHAMHDFGPKPKRIKMEIPRAGTIGPPGYPPPYHPMNGQPGPHFNGLTNTLPYNAQPPPLSNFEDSALGAPGRQTAQTPPSATSYNSLQTNIPARPRTSTSHAPDLQNPEYASPASHLQLVPSYYRLDLSTAPGDPIELVGWLRQQMEQAASSPDGGRSSDANLHLSDPNTPQSATGHPQVSYHEPDAAAEKNRLRQENRMRKQRWRQDNQERNKDNDLRCRVNKLAKTKFGVEDSPEKAQFIENEFTLRRAKREQKQRNRAQSSVPVFASANGASGDANGVHSNMVDSNVANTLLNLRRGNEHGSREVSNADVEAAERMRADLQSGALSHEQFYHAARYAVDVQRNEEYGRPLHPGPGQWMEAESRRSSSGGDEPTRFPAAQPLHYGGHPLPAQMGPVPMVPAPMGPTQFPFMPPSAVPPALNGGAAENTYASPYATKLPSIPPEPVIEPSVQEEPPAPVTTVAAESPKTKEPSKTPEPPIKPTTDPEVLVDALLTAADVSDDDDDEVEDEDRMVVDPPEQQSKRSGHRARGSKRKSKLLSMPRRNRQKNAATKSKASVSPAAASSRRNQAGEDEGAELRRQFEESELAVNTIVPVKKAQAVSKISHTPNGYAATNDTNGTNRLDHGSGIAPSDSTHNTSYEEEQKKIRQYGFPPLPGVSRSA